MTDEHDYANYTAPEDAPPHGDDEQQTHAPASRAEIVIGTDLERVVGEAIAALVADTSIYQRGRHLTHIIGATDEDARVLHREPGAVLLERVPRDWLVVVLARVAAWVAIRKKKDGSTARVSVTPPPQIVGAVAAAPTWPRIRQLVGVTESPVMRPDGTILDRPGYDEATGLYYQPVGAVAAIPAQPTRADAERALAELLEVVADFPFAGDEHRAAWLSCVLTLFARPLIDGPTPLFVVEAPAAGTGKSLLAKVTGIIATGRTPATCPWPVEEPEREKTITTWAIEAPSLVLLDNVTGELGGGRLDLIVTSTVYSARRLGKSETTSALPWSTVLVATANNVTYGPDTPRRVIPIRIDSQTERPEERGGFQIAELEPWVRANRPRLAAAALTVLRAWCVAGRPKTKLPDMGMFESWTAIVRQVVCWLGMADPLLTQRDAIAAGAGGDRAELAALLGGLRELLGPGAAPVSEILRLLRADGIADAATRKAQLAKGAALRDALIEYMPTRSGELPDARALGNRLKQFRDRVSRDMQLIGRPGHGATLNWRVGVVGVVGRPPIVPNSDPGNAHAKGWEETHQTHHTHHTHHAYRAEQDEDVSR